MKTLYQLDDGFSANGGITENGWYACVLQLGNHYDTFMPLTNTDSYDTNVHNIHLWQQASVGLPRTLTLITPQADGFREQIIGSAERIDGPVCPKEVTSTPLIAWIQRKQNAWELICYHENRSFVVHRSSGMLRRPSLAYVNGTVYLACERDTESIDQGAISIFDISGKEYLSMQGRAPKLIARNDRVLLLTEQTARNCVTLEAIEFSGEKEFNRWTLQSDDYSIHADMVTDKNGVTYIVAECCPALGEDDRLGMHRDVYLWQIDENGTLQKSSGPDDRVPTQRTTFNYWSTENMPPIYPSVVCDEEGVIVCYRQFRYFEIKTFGWDIWMCRYKNGKWEEPGRCTEHLTTPDTSYALIPYKNHLIGMFPFIENNGGPSACFDCRVAIVMVDAMLPVVEVPEDKRDTYYISVGMKDLAPEPPFLGKRYEGRTLVWGDLHQHTCYSKCVAASDGCPDANLRFTRDALGCSVFTVTPHRLMNDSEATWLMDQVEKQAGDNGVILYGCEPGSHPGRHTNYYTYDREIYERLKTIVFSHDRKRQWIYRHIRESLPLGSVVALRHVHGHMMDDEEIVQSFDPQLEVAMESMQGRANALIKEEGKLPKFPVQFLNAGFKIGLVGGTDHFRARGPNRFCLTGFWVKELTSEGVWEALKNRYTIAMSNARVAMCTQLGDIPMGGTVSVSQGDGVRVNVSVSCVSRIIRASLIKDGETLPWVDVGSQSAEIELVDSNPNPGRHWYVPTVEVETAYGKERMGYAHSSPFFVMVEKQERM